MTVIIILISRKIIPDMKKDNKGFQRYPFRQEKWLMWLGVEVINTRGGLL